MGLLPRVIGSPSTFDTYSQVVAGAGAQLTFFPALGLMCVQFCVDCLMELCAFPLVTLTSRRSAARRPVATVQPGLSAAVLRLFGTISGPLLTILQSLLFTFVAVGDRVGPLCLAAIMFWTSCALFRTLHVAPLLVEASTHSTSIIPFICES